MKRWMIERMFWRPKPPVGPIDQPSFKWFKLKNRISTFWDMFRRKP